MNAYLISAAAPDGRRAFWHAWSAKVPEGFGQVVGLDVADEMVRQAREASKDFRKHSLRLGIGACRFPGKRIL